MERISSFCIDHMKLLPGIYVSRKDSFGDCIITTFDIRITRPNFEPVMNTAEVHTFEHLIATYLRNHPKVSKSVVYFGPMGCRTGFYLILHGDYKSRDIVPLMKEVFEFVMNFSGKIPGATKEECGNCSDMDLVKAQSIARKFYHEVLQSISDKNLIYPGMTVE